MNKDFITSNFHTHTERCKHAIGSEREFIEKAIEMGVERLGFSDHVPCPFKTGYVSNIRMGWDQAEEYVNCIRQLKEEYKDKIEIFVGFEAEYMPEFFEEQCQMYDRLDADYVILGAHWLGSEEFNEYNGHPGLSEEQLKAYVDSCLEAMATGRYLYLAHPDLINYQEKDEIYQREMLRLCEGMKAMNKPIECNMLGYMEGKHYPTKKFWEIAGKVGGPVCIGLDAHYIRNIVNKDAYAYCVNMMRECGITEFVNEDFLR